MSILAYSADIIIRVIPNFPPRFEIKKFDIYCKKSISNCLEITNSFAVDLSTVYVIILGIGVVISSFILLQIILVSLLTHKIEKSRNPILSNYWSNQFSRKTGLPINNIQIEIINSVKLEAFSFSLFHLKKSSIKRHYIVISNNLLKILSEKETLNVIAHEYGHIYLQDTIWVPLLKLLGFSKIFPFNKIQKRLTKSIELRADKLSAQWTRTPNHLASALLKMYEQSFKSDFFNDTNKLTSSVYSKENHLLFERIEKLLEMNIEILPFTWPKV